MRFSSRFWSSCDGADGCPTGRSRPSFTWMTTTSQRSKTNLSTPNAWPATKTAKCWSGRETPHPPRPRRSRNPLQAHCHLGLGTLYAEVGQREQAQAELSVAIDLYRAMEMTF